MQKKQSLDRFYPRTFALWVAISALGAIAPAQAGTISASTNATLKTHGADQIDQGAIAEAVGNATDPQQLALASTRNVSQPESMAVATNAALTAIAKHLTVPEHHETAPQEIAANVVAPADPSQASIASLTDLASLSSPSDSTKVNAQADTTKTATTVVAQTPNPNPTITPNPAPNPTITPNPQDQILLQGSPNEPRVLVAEIKINGTNDNAELEQAIVKAIETKAGRPTTVSQIRSDVNRIYATGLFSNVTATPEDTALGVRVSFDVVPNPVLKKVVLQALPKEGNLGITPPDEVDKIFGDRYGQIINLNDFQEGSARLKQLQKWYEDNGYDLAKVIGIDEPSADGVVTLVAVEGVLEGIKVNFINANNETVKGRTREFIITREMELKPGAVFRRDIAQRDLQRIFGLGLFEDVKLAFTSGTEDPTKAILNLNVIESNTGSIAAGGGISSASGLFGSVSYQQKNLGGNNQNLSTEFQLGTRDALFDVSFTDPWIAGDPYRTSYTLNAFRRRSISLIFDGGNPEVDLPNGDRPRVNRIGGGLSFSRPLSKDVFAPAAWRASLGFDYDRVRITDANGDTDFIDAAGNRLSFSDKGIDSLYTMSLGLVNDKRFTINGASRGSVLRFGTDQTIPLGSGNIFFNRLRGSYSLYLDPPFKLPSLGKEKKPHTLALNIQGGTVLGDLPPYEAFSLGGSNSVRGFEEGAVGSGKRYIQGTAEYRFPIFSVVGGALFADYATDLGSGKDVPGDPAGVRGKPGHGLGYGFGVRVQSPLGQIRVDYGIADNGDTRINFGIGERF